MAQGRGWAQAAADGIMGYVKGVQLQQDLDDKQASNKRAQEEHDARMQEVKDKNDLKANLKAAAAPQTVQQGAGGVTLPADADNRDVGQPDGPTMDNGQLKAGVRVGNQSYDTESAGNAAAAQYNSPEALNARQVAVYRAAGMPMEGQQLETSQVQGQAAKLTLDKATHDFINQKLDERLGEVGTPEELAQHASTLTGKQVQAVMSPDGKTAHLAYAGPDGQLIQYGKDFDNTPEGVSRAAIGYAKTMKPGEKITALMHFATLDETRAHNAATEDQGQQKIDEEGRHNVVSEKQGQQRIGLEGAQVGIARAGLGLREQELALHGRTVDLAEKKYLEDLKQDPERNLPEGTRLQVRSLSKTIDRIDNHVAQAMATPGGWDPKDPGAQDLLAQRKAASIKLQQLTEPYTGGGAGKPAGGNSYADFMRTSGGTGTGKPAPGAVAPTQQPAPGAAPAGQATSGVMNFLRSAVPGTTGAPAAPGAAAPVPAPAAPPTLQRILNPSGNSSLDAVLAPRVQAITAAGQAVKQAMDDVAFAAKSQDPNKVQTATQRSQAAAAAFTNSLGGMNEQQQAQVREILGI